jgi:MFS family permease
MQREMRWYEHLPINIYWLGINIASGLLTPIILPYLVVLFMPPEQKNTYLATIRVVGLAVAMMFQPMAGMLSDRSTSRWGRRRPFIFASAILNVIFLAIIGISPRFMGSPADAFFVENFGITTAYFVLLVGIVLIQFSSNLGHGALQGLIPDVVPENQRGRSSGVKSVLELLPVFLVIFIGPLVDRGLIGITVAIIAAGFLITMSITMIFVRENPNLERPTGPIAGPLLRLAALAAIFVAVSQAAVALVRFSGERVAGGETLQIIIVVGLAGLLAMAGSIFIGVYLGAWVGIGAEARQQRSFIWWVINRLLFLAAVGSIQGFAQFFLGDVLQIPNPATMTTVLLAVVAVFLMPSAIGGGYLADRIGRKRLVALAGIVAAFGAVVLLFSRNIPMVIVAGSIIGLATGTFFATNWALGTDIVPKAQAGRYLGISNLAGAGAGIVGAGIGGPMADYFNAIQPGLGYLVIFGIYAMLFLLSTLTLTQVKVGKWEGASGQHLSL